MQLVLNASINRPLLCLIFVFLNGNLHSESPELGKINTIDQTIFHVNILFINGR